jgi:hypothetical protein
MRGVAAALGIAGAILVLGAIGLAEWAGLRGGLGQVIATLFLDSKPTTHLAYVVLLINLVAVLVVGALAWLKRPREASSEALTVLSFTPPDLGLATAAYAGFTIHQAMVATGTTKLQIIAPGLAEAILVLGAGVLVGATAAALNVGLGACAAKAGAP